MKQIDKIARELKKEFAGTYNNYYQSATIYIDMANDCLYLQKWGQGETWLNGTPEELTPLCGFGPSYGNWGDTFGDAKNWSLTKKRIADDIKNESNIDFNELPEWLQDEINFYLS